MKTKLPIEVRQAYNLEHNFIYNSWIKSGYRSRAMELVAKEIYTLNQHDVITHLLARSTVLVAQELNKPESLYGYIIYQVVDGVFVLHYAYTKQMFRNLGVFSSLLSATGYNGQTNAGFYTHVTKPGSIISQKHNLFYNPYMLINPKYEVLASAPKSAVIPAILPADSLYTADDAAIDNTYSVVGLNSSDEPVVHYEYAPPVVEPAQPEEDYVPENDPNHPDYDPDFQYQK